MNILLMVLFALVGAIIFLTGCMLSVSLRGKRREHAGRMVYWLGIFIGLTLMHVAFATKGAIGDWSVWKLMMIVNAVGASVPTFFENQVRYSMDRISHFAFGTP